MGWEFTILDALQQIHTPLLDKILVFITSLGNAGWFWIVLGLVLLREEIQKVWRSCAGGADIIRFVWKYYIKAAGGQAASRWINDTVETA